LCRYAAFFTYGTKELGLVKRVIRSVNNASLSKRTESGWEWAGGGIWSFGVSTLKASELNSDSFRYHNIPYNVIFFISQLVF
jgi:hypothetical protein